MTPADKLKQMMANVSAPPSAERASSAYSPELICMADVEPCDVPWLWPRRIPLGRLSLLVGRPGCGKSLVTSDLAARVSTGTEFPDGTPSLLGDVLMIAAEDDPGDTIAPRLIGAGARLSRVKLLKAAKWLDQDGKDRTVAFDLANVDLIAMALDQMDECKLVIIDPIGHYLGGRTDAHRDNEVRAVLAPLAELARVRNVAILMVCHTRKMASLHADDTVLGSRAFTGLARSVLHLLVDENDKERKLLLAGKSNLGRPADGLAFRIQGESSPSLDWEPEPLVGVDADSLIQTATNAGSKNRDSVERNSAAQWLIDFLSTGPVPTVEVEAAAKSAGYSFSTVRRAKDSIGIVPTKQSFSGKWIWSLPEDAQPTVPSRPRRETNEHLGEKRQKNPCISQDAQVNILVEDDHLGKGSGLLFPNMKDQRLPD